jgi:hypothetical protein
VVSDFTNIMEVAKMCFPQGIRIEHITTRRGMILIKDTSNRLERVQETVSSDELNNVLPVIKYDHRRDKGLSKHLSLRAAFVVKNEFLKGRPENHQPRAL